MAEATEDEDERARQMNFVLVGAGPTGVELAASIAQMVRVTLRGNFRQIDPATSRITLIEGGDRILPSFAPSLSTQAAGRLAKLGVKVMTGVKVDRVDKEGVIAGGERIPSATVLWTAGMAASPIVRLLGAETDRAGRALVGPFLDLPAAPNIFVVGDAASLQQDGRPIPGVAQAAIQQGRYVGRLISDRIRRAGSEAPVSIPGQGQHGGRRQELRHPGGRPPENEWLPHLVYLGFHSFDGAPPASESLAGSIAMAMVVSDGTAQLAVDF